MQKVSKNDILELAQMDGGPCVSLYLPTHKTGEQMQQDVIRLRNLITRAREQLIQNGLRAPEAEALLRPVEQRLTDDIFWQHQDLGLAIYLNQNGMHIFRLPISFEEQCVVSYRFHIKPLLPLLKQAGTFYILAFSQNEVRFFRSSSDDIHEIDLKELPSKMSDVEKFHDSEAQLQYHTRTSSHQADLSRDAIFHGHGVGKGQSKDLVEPFMRALSTTVSAYLQSETAPLILAGVEYEIAMYRKHNTYPHLITPAIQGNPERWTARELHKTAYEKIKPLLMKDEEDLRARIQQEQTRGNVGTDLRSVLPPAFNGRVGALFVPLNHAVWGRFDHTNNRVEIHDRIYSGDEDLLDLAAVYTLVREGDVFAVDQTQMPDTKDVVALYRY